MSEFVSADVTTAKYSYTDKESKTSINDDKSYVVKLTWKYKEDLGYQTSATIRLVHEDKVLSIVSIDSYKETVIQFLFLLDLKGISVYLFIIPI